MEIFHIENLSFAYGGAEENVISGISAQIREGEFVVLCGESGCGKTTLLRLLKPELAPFGKLSGEIRYRETPVSALDSKISAAEIGFVMQNPENQIVTDKVWHELAFGAENLGFPPEVIRRRVAEISAYFGIQDWFHQDTAVLSGGQKQILNLAAVTVCEPRVLLLDEPTSALDPVAASSFLQHLYKLNRELGVTVVIAEHRLEEVLPMADRVLVLHDGTLRYDIKPKDLTEIFRQGTWDNGLLQAMPAALQVYQAMDGVGDCPLTVREGREYLASRYTGISGRIRTNSPDSDASVPWALEIRQIGFRYERQLPDVLRNVSLYVKEGACFFVVGGNAAGKTTLLQLIAGLRKPYKGKILSGGKSMALLPQNPQVVFLTASVQADYEEVLRMRGIPVSEWASRIGAVVDMLGLCIPLSRHPYDLSGGEQQKAALGKLLLSEPRILLLDEPTKGLDAAARRELSRILKSLCRQGVTILTVTHDLDFCADNADRCALLADGEIAAEGEPHAFFAGNRFYTTATNRMSRGYCDNAITCAELTAFLKEATREQEGDI